MFIQLQSSWKLCQNQLKEMRLERILREQPILNFEEERFNICRPAFYYTPPLDEYSFQSKYSYNTRIRNLTAFVAIQIDIKAELLVQKMVKLYP
jgi:hypothetical protein